MKIRHHLMDQVELTGALMILEGRCFMEAAPSDTNRYREASAAARSVSPYFTAEPLDDEAAEVLAACKAVRKLMGDGGL